MPELVPSAASPTFGGSDPYHNQREEAYEMAAHLIADLSDRPGLQAALWLYVDDLERSHEISQGIHTPVGSFWHGIMHRREGDFWNSKYWFRQAGRPPFELTDYDPARFVDQVEAANGSNPSALLDLQRREWKALYDYCQKEGL